MNLDKLYAAVTNSSSYLDELVEVKRTYIKKRKPAVVKPNKTVSVR
jgi:hypothetical protein